MCFATHGIHFLFYVTTVFIIGTSLLHIVGIQIDRPGNTRIRDNKDQRAYSHFIRGKQPRKTTTRYTESTKPPHHVEVFQYAVRARVYSKEIRGRIFFGISDLFPNSPEFYAEAKLQAIERTLVKGSVPYTEDVIIEIIDEVYTWLLPNDKKPSEEEQKRQAFIKEYS